MTVAFLYKFDCKVLYKIKHVKKYVLYNKSQIREMCFRKKYRNFSFL